MRAPPCDTMPDSNGSFLARPQARPPRKYGAANMKAHMPMMPRKKIPRAQYCAVSDTPAVMANSSDPKPSRTQRPDAGCPSTRAKDTRTAVGFPQGDCGHKVEENRRAVRPLLQLSPG